MRSSHHHGSQTLTPPPSGHTQVVEDQVLISNSTSSDTTLTPSIPSSSSTTISISSTEDIDLTDFMPPHHDVNENRNQIGLGAILGELNWDRIIVVNDVLGEVPAPPREIRTVPARSPVIFWTVDRIRTVDPRCSTSGGSPTCFLRISRSMRVSEPGDDPASAGEDRGNDDISPTTVRKNERRARRTWPHRGTTRWATHTPQETSWLEEKIY